MHYHNLLAGIDLGGTKIEGVVVDATNSANVPYRLRRPTQSERGYDHIVEQLCDLVSEMRAAIGPEFPNAIGVGTPGTLDPQTKTLRGSNTTCLNGKPILIDLEERLETRVHIANDANCFALAESTLGAGRGYETVFGIIMGTGCGGGYVVRGHVLTGCHSIAGEWGQVVVEPGGDISPHGTRGTVEAYISGRALEAFYHSKTTIHRSLYEIVTRAEIDHAARATLERLQAYFARSLAVVVNTFDPHVIIVGGGVGNLDVLYCEETRRRVAEHVFAPNFETGTLET